MPVILIYITALLLVIGVFPLPYDYYMLLRLIVTSVFIWAAIITHKLGLVNLMWLCSGIALLFNPLLKIHLGSGLWAVIDVFTAVLLIAIRNKIKSTNHSITS
jgi:hypothetical protein